MSRATRLELAGLGALGRRGQRRSEAGVEGLWLPGDVPHAGKNRRVLPELSPSIEAEVFNSTIEELREAAARAMRREVV